MRRRIRRIASQFCTETGHRTVSRHQIRSRMQEIVFHIPKSRQYYHGKLTLLEIGKIMHVHLTLVARLKSQGILKLQTHLSRHGRAE